MLFVAQRGSWRQMNLNESLMKTETPQHSRFFFFFSNEKVFVSPVSPVVCTALSRNTTVEKEGEIARSLVSVCTGYSICNSCSLWAHRWSALQTTRQDLLRFGPQTVWDWKFEINEFTDALCQLVGLCIWCPYFWSIRSHKSQFLPKFSALLECQDAGCDSFFRKHRARL